MNNSHGWKLICDERQRQIKEEGWTADHDRQYSPKILSQAANCYWRALDPQAPMDPEWPWGSRWWEPKDRLRNLVRAGALYLAAYDRARNGNPATAGNNWSRAIRCAEVIDQLPA